MSTQTHTQLNSRAIELLERHENDSFKAWGVKTSTTGGAEVHHFGACESQEAGLFLTKICMADFGCASIVPDTRSYQNFDAKELPKLRMSVFSKEPVIACLGSQFAGWQYSCGKNWVGMLSGPIRLALKKEALLEELKLTEGSPQNVVGVLESSVEITPEIVEDIAKQLGIKPKALILLVAPMECPAGTVQVTGRGLEVALHQLHEQLHKGDFGIKLDWLEFGRASMLLPEPSSKNDKAMNDANDVIIKGGEAELHFSRFAHDGTPLSDEQLFVLGPKLISSNYARYEEPFGTLLREFQGDFTQAGEMFTTAVVTLINLDTGSQKTFGQIDLSALIQSLQTTDFSGKK